MTKNSADTVTLSINIELPRQYMDFYERLVALGAHIGSIEDIAVGGVIGYLNVLHDTLLETMTYAAPDVRKDLSIA